MEKLWNSCQQFFLTSSALFGESRIISWSVVPSFIMAVIVPLVAMKISSSIMCAWPPLVWSLLAVTK